MRTMAKVGVAALAVVLWAPPAEAQDGSPIVPRLDNVEQIGRDVQRYHFSYGPLIALPGQNQIVVAPHPVGPGQDGYLIRTQADIVRDDGRPPPVEEVHMHHAVYVNLSRRDATAPGLPERFFGWAEEKTMAQAPPGYGYFTRATDQGAINYMLHNGTARSEEVWLTYVVDFVPASSETGRQLEPLRPLWMDVQNGKAYPVFDVRRGDGGEDGQVTYPDDYPDAYGGGVARNEWTVDRDGTLVVTAGHVHPGGLWTDLELVRDGRTMRVFRSNARYFDPNGPISWDMAMEVTPEEWRVGVRRGDTLRVTTTYETERASWYESMGIMLVFMSEETDGPDPFVAPPPQDGFVTHGHLPEASNHGGEPTGLPDARELLDGRTIDDRVGIAAFQYLPGNLGGTGMLGNPPVVRPGASLRFGNVDAAAGIHHTITACEAPCNGSTGISYPLADGEVDFDSGQLGYGLDGYTAAKQEAEWETPRNLDPGTYTYFCRVHPFMRGAFRVKD